MARDNGYSILPLLYMLLDFLGGTPLFRQRIYIDCKSTWSLHSSFYVSDPVSDQ